MKKIWIAAVVAAVVCATVYLAVPPAEEPEEVVTKYIAALKSGDVAGVESCFGGEWLEQYRIAKEETGDLPSEMKAEIEGVELEGLKRVDGHRRVVVIEAVFRKGKKRQARLYTLKRRLLNWKITFARFDAAATEKLNEGVEEEEEKTEMQLKYESAVTLMDEGGKLFEEEKYAEAGEKFASAREVLDEMMSEGEEKVEEGKVSPESVAKLESGLREMMLRCELAGGR